jgi:phenylacetate-coenzyme A ligase PaaK-like adenylate-forming protein
MTYAEFLAIPPFSLGKAEKEAILGERLRQLTNHHVEHCPPYAKMVKASGNAMPFLPVRLFKKLELKSTDEVFKVVTSSGTTGQAVSKIYLDKATVANQQKTLAKIVSDFTGSARMPMLIIDSPSVIKNRAMFSARGAGMLGFSIFGADKTYALDDDMKIDIAAVENFIERHKTEKVLLFGFTFMVWLHFYKELLKLEHKLDLSNGILIHGGGWKKLTSEEVSKSEFKQRLTYTCGLRHIHDYYGMVEQAGCIYMECEYGHLHASIFSDIITRRPFDFSLCCFGEHGIMQVVSALPESYPGHSLITEDEGVIIGEDDCQCGRKGKYFEVTGRLKSAEIRGCSDTYATAR